jgi:hypothetical protein
LPAAIPSDPTISRGVQIKHTKNMSLRVTPKGRVEISAAFTPLISSSGSILSNIGSERRSASTLCQEHNLEELTKVYAAHGHLDLPEPSRLGYN